MNEVASDPVAQLVLAMLAVNGWRLEQSCEIYGRLESEGLFDMDRVGGMNHGELFLALKRAGYKKSDFVIDLICDRLFDLAKCLREKKKNFYSLCEAGNREDLSLFCRAINGVGPKVFENFMVLWSNNLEHRNHLSSK